MTVDLSHSIFFFFFFVFSNEEGLDNYIHEKGKKVAK